MPVTTTQRVENIKRKIRQREDIQEEYFLAEQRKDKPYISPLLASVTIPLLTALHFGEEIIPPYQKAMQ